jgi:YihY family inner membrane protein
MQAFRRSAQKVVADPLGFLVQVVKAFRANQGLLLAGGVAYYTLLSIVPLLILLVIVLSHVVDTALLLDTLARYLEIVVPGQSGPILEDMRAFIEHRSVIGPTLAVTMVFFSSLAFTVLENAMSVIFFHRVAVQRRHFIASALLPYLYILLLAIGLLIVTVMASMLQRLAGESIDVIGRELSLGRLSSLLLYLLGVGGEIVLLSSIYLVMPVGRISWRHALVGGIAAALLWEISRHVLVWYYATLSQVRTVYGSLTTAIVVLLSLEIASIVLLFGAQVIAEYERIGHEPIARRPEEMSTRKAG